LNAILFGWTLWI